MAIACCYGAIVLVLRPYIIEGYTPNAQVVAAALPLVLIVVCYHLFDALQITTAFVLRAYKVAVVPTVIYAVALWGVGLGGGYVLRRARLLGGEYRESGDCGHRLADVLACGEQAAFACRGGASGGFGDLTGLSVVGCRMAGLSS
jgi:hypothetical protein